MVFKILLSGIILHLMTHGTAGQDPALCYNGVYIDGVCHYVSQTKATAAEGNQVCSSSVGGTVPVIRDAETQARVAAMLRSLGSPDVLLDIVEEDVGTEWHWESDNTVITAQGCFTDNSTFHDLPEEISVLNLSPETCIQGCRNRGYRYAGLQNGFQCYCGNSFGRYGTATPCVTKCRTGKTNSVLSQWCGGVGLNFVYDVNGIMHGSWGYNQPNNYENYQSCATVDTSIEYKYGDEKCGRRLQYICHITSGPQLASCNAENYYKEDSDCLYMGTTPTDWYTARRVCAGLAGHLVKIPDADMQARVQRVIMLYGHAQKYWTGLTKITGLGWRWRDGSQATYTNWAALSPNQRSERCAIMSAREDYEWDDVDCDTEFHVLCTGENKAPTTTTSTTTTTLPTTTTTVATTTTTAKPITTTTTTNSPGQATTTTTKQSTASPTAVPTATDGGPEVTTAGDAGGGTGNDPDVEQSTEASGLKWYEILMIALGVLLALAVLLCLLVLCCLMKKNKHRKVGYVYDARPKAPIPVSAPISASNVTFNSIKSTSVGSGSTETLREHHHY